MRRVRAITALVLSAFILLCFSPSAAAAAEQNRRPVDFTIDPADCPAIQSAVTGTGEWFERINTRVGKDGTTYVVYSATAKGTAVDEDGNTYRFNYHNHQNFAVPADGSPFQVRMTDHFNLVASGGANDIHTGFVVLMTFASPTDLDPISFDLFINRRGYSEDSFPPCDPI